MRTSLAVQGLLALQPPNPMLVISRTLPKNTGKVEPSKSSEEETDENPFAAQGFVALQLLKPCSFMHHFVANTIYFELFQNSSGSVMFSDSIMLPSFTNS
jgi:hypothetical protein